MVAVSVGRGVQLNDLFTLTFQYFQSILIKGEQLTKWLLRKVSKHNVLEAVTSTDKLLAHVC